MDEVSQFSALPESQEVVSADLPTRRSRMRAQLREVPDQGATSPRVYVIDEEHNNYQETPNKPETLVSESEILQFRSQLAFHRANYVWDVAEYRDLHDVPARQWPRPYGFYDRVRGVPRSERQQMLGGKIAAEKIAYDRTYQQLTEYEYVYAKQQRYSDSQVREALIGKAETEFAYIESRIFGIYSELDRRDVFPPRLPGDVLDSVQTSLRSIVRDRRVAKLVDRYISDIRQLTDVKLALWMPTPLDYAHDDIWKQERARWISAEIKYSLGRTAAHRQIFAPQSPHHAK